MSRTLDRVTRELAEVADLLLAVSEDDFATRHELLTRRDTLREEADAFAENLDTDRSTRDVIHELVEMRAQLREEVQRNASRLMMGGPGGTGGAAGAVSGEMVKLTLKAKAATRIDELTARVAALEGVLLERGVDLEKATTLASQPRAEPAG